MPLCILLSRTDADLGLQNLLSANLPYQHSQPVSLNHVAAANWMAEMGSDPFAQVANVRSRQIHSRVNAREFLESRHGNSAADDPAGPGRQ